MSWVPVGVRTSTSSNSTELSVVGAVVSTGSLRALEFASTSP
jgi:hypothetical protein